MAASNRNRQFTPSSNSMAEQVEFLAREKIAVAIEKKNTLLKAIEALNLFQFAYRVEDKFKIFHNLIVQFTEDMGEISFKPSTFEQQKLFPLTTGFLTIENIQLYYLSKHLLSPHVPQAEAKEIYNRIVERIAWLSAEAINKIKHTEYDKIMAHDSQNQGQNNARCCVVS